MTTTTYRRRMDLLAALAESPQPGIKAISSRFGWTELSGAGDHLRELYRLGYVDRPFKRGFVGVTRKGIEALTKEGKLPSMYSTVPNAKKNERGNAEVKHYAPKVDTKADLDARLDRIEVKVTRFEKSLKSKRHIANEVAHD